MIVFGVTVEADVLLKALRTAPREFNRAFVSGLRKYLESFRARISRERLRGRPGLKRRTGFLAASQKTVVVGDRLANVVGVYAIGGGVVKYARLHEYGGVVRPVKGKFLAVPMSANQTKAGVARAAPRDLANTFVLRGMIFQRPADKDGVPVAMFALKRSVTIPPRLGVREEWARDIDRRKAFMVAALSAGIHQAGLK